MSELEIDCVDFTKSQPRANDKSLTIVYDVFFVKVF